MLDRTIPFVRLSPVPEDVQKAVQEVMDSGVFFNGKYSTLFESSFKKYLSIDHFIPTANCTDALEIILRAHEIGAGDEVIVPAFTWFSDASVVQLVGAKPVFGDVDLTHYGLDISSTEALLGGKTKAIIVPHLFGSTHPEIKQFRQMCDEHQLLLIEDCAQAHGSTLNNCLAGTFGHMAAFSFYPTKNLGALGDAGCIVTNDAHFSHQYKLWSNHGQQERNNHLQLGRNSRMDEIQAAVLMARLPYLKQNNDRRRELAKMYLRELAHLPIALPEENNGHVYHQFVIRLEKRDALKDFLLSKGIQTDIHYPTALSDMDCFQKSVPADCPNARLVAATILSLPIHPNHEVADVNYVCQQIKVFFKG
ncbi:DegT/DnrJ/EryC1/StrS family aminotransferase [Marivirga sp. S37H4]|uniref:DegT/DnrJ/EryC1/StrS family aminotransferase n=1 Tax=Marivirga aurantiaca TaxID=2802615 RepID=A0A934X2K7_9BACT|nr:DegT/DnrJ/EryC1/StrS family aminotransferase [Marivirga aurantiaca]MBK6267292.1 DegT/DnrJ/EryC1/StrS family aminotransferase [Marivirga aurantiaca]